MSSAGFVPVEPERADAEARARADAWKSAQIAVAQRALADIELARWRKGERVAPFDAFLHLLRSIDPAPDSILEIGSGSGYYAELLDAADLGAIPYYGLDYSPAMLEIARARVPRGTFALGDAEHLHLPDRMHDLVVSGCVMVHLADWRASIREAARVSRRWVMIHRLQTVLSGPERTFSKEAYGERCFERWFALRDVLQACESAGLRLMRSATVAEAPDHVIASYLMERV